MPRNLSLPTANSTGNFYSRIHAQMRTSVASTGKLTPTAQQLKDIVERHCPDGAGRLALDAGCGLNAFNAHTLAAHGYAVKAIDINPDVSQQQVSSDRVRFIVGSVMDIPFPDGHFDLVVCAGVAHHTPDPEKALGEVMRVTKKGGTMIVALYCSRDSLYEVVIRCVRRVGRFVPYSVLQTLFKGIPSIGNFVLDSMYVPILWLFSAEEVRALVKAKDASIMDEENAPYDFLHRSVRPQFLRKALIRDGMYRWFVIKR
jgi:ubiquinone/menaquinone biosynthesis C-methylase UbiE